MMNKNTHKEPNDVNFAIRWFTRLTKKGVRYYWIHVRNDLRTLYGTPKAIFGESGLNDVIIDVKGEYGMTQGAMAIPIESQEDGEKLKEFLMSDSFKETY